MFICLFFPLGSNGAIVSVSVKLLRYFLMACFNLMEYLFTEMSMIHQGMSSSGGFLRYFLPAWPPGFLTSHLADDRKPKSFREARASVSRGKQLQHFNDDIPPGFSLVCCDDLGFPKVRCSLIYFW